MANHINGAPLIVETTTELSAVVVGFLISTHVLFSKLKYNASCSIFLHTLHQDQNELDDPSLKMVAEGCNDDTGDDPKQIIELNFALGDFNDSALALAEEELLVGGGENDDNSNDSDKED